MPQVNRDFGVPSGNSLGRPNDWLGRPTDWKRSTDWT